MIKFIYIDGDKVVDPQKTPLDQSSNFQSMENDFRQATSSLVCPKHGTDARATIILNVGLNVHAYQRAWDFEDFCCPGFADLIQSSLSDHLAAARMKSQ